MGHNKTNSIENHEICHICWLIGSRFQGPMSQPRTLSNDILRWPVAEKIFKFML